jgi:4-azaleucine resistance transporter AzlC
MDSLQLTRKKIFYNSIPVGIAYLILGSSFGILFSTKGGSFIETILISTFCFAGAAQFASLKFYNSQTSFSYVFLILFLINIRHIFYGLTISNNWISKKKWYLLSALTDENYAMFNFYRNLNLSELNLVMIFAINHLYWIFGCIIGFAFEKQINVSLKGADFILTALFIAMLMTKTKELPN